MARVFSVGDLNVDILCRVKGIAKMGREENIRTIDFSIGGNAANFACAAGKLGLDVELVSAIGEGTFTEFLLRELAKAKVKENLFRATGKNGCSIVLVNGKGERAIYSSKGVCEKISSKIIWEKIGGKIRKGDIVYFGGYFHLRGMHPGFRELLEKIKKKGCITAFDLCYDEFGEWKISPFLKHIDYLFLNKLELEKASRGKNNGKRAEFLLGKGAKEIILKQGSKGAAVYSGNKIIREKGIKVKSIDTTGAGDIFNAAFIRAKERGCNDKASLKAANIISSYKVQRTGIIVPEWKTVKKKLSSENLIETIAAQNENEIAKIVVSEIKELLKGKPDAVMGLAAGKTPEKTYRLLVDECAGKKIDFSHARFFGLDEYIGLGAEDGKSFAHQLKGFLSKTNAKEKNIMLFNGNSKNPEEECRRLEKKIREWGGIDLTLLGIGKNCHIAFNEPGTSFDSGVHIAKLSEKTREANKAKFKRKEDAPKEAITVGLNTIMGSKRIILAASGKEKAAAIRQTAEGKRAEKYPSTILQGHRNTKIIVDRKAAAFLSSART